MTDSPKLDDVQLNRFIRTFYGLGNLDADYWFVGMEPGGGKTFREVQQVLDRWIELGSGPVLDNYEIHRAMHNDKDQLLSELFFEPPVQKIQKTWAGLIRMMLAIEGDEDDSRDRVAEVQSQRWGRLESNNCLVEVFPLPCPAVSHWHYHEWSSLPYLKSRKIYHESRRSSRVADLRGLIRRHRPKVVVFYSVSGGYVRLWSEIVGTEIEEIDLIEVAKNGQGTSLKARFWESNGTVFANTIHTAWQGINKDYCRKVGLRVGEMLGKIGG